jgi:branched-chain amino acid aminotransferase
VGAMNGWGVFSTIKVVDGVLFAFARHWARMRRDAELMRVPFPWTPDELEESLLRLVEANNAMNSTLRVAVMRNKGTAFEGPAPARDVDLIAFTINRAQWGEACRLGIVPNARHAANVFAGTKILAWAMNLAWYEEAHARGFDEVVLLNERGEVSECTSANLFAVFGDTAVTPPLTSGCLPGTCFRWWRWKDCRSVRNRAFAPHSARGSRGMRRIMSRRRDGGRAPLYDDLRFVETDSHSLPAVRFA